jgi:protein phosphatase
VAGREGFVIDAENRHFLADLTLCRLLSEDELPDSRPLASLLYYLSTGKELTREVNEALVPEELRALLKQWGEEAKTLDDFLELLDRVPPLDAPRRALRQLAGNATDTGRKRKSNEDWVATLTYSLDRTGHSIPLGLYIVADGMGGHAAGEHASSSGVRQPLLHFVEQQILPDLRNVTRRLSPEITSEDKLQAMVQVANKRVYENRIQSGGDRGSTITIAMILGNECVVANVGDSRTYLYRDGRLQQLTEDHSLVARLVQAGEIGPEEIYTHAQRNQIYRSLGDQLEIAVDTFPLQLRVGDRLLLCSDGLWEMVRDPQMAQILADEPNPQLACDRMVAAANVNGGEDNISVIIVELQ